jgi:2-hydroxychromene-2-carboxylate isomerase
MSAALFDPLSSSAPLIIYVDYKSPYAYLAKDPIYTLQDDLGIEVDWRPFTLDIPSYLGSARLDDKGRLVENQRSERQWNVVRYSYRDVRRYGSRRGLIVRGTTKIWNSSLAAIGMLWAKERDRTVMRRYSGLVYERFWKRELDIEDIAVVESVLAEAGAPTAGFQRYANGEGRYLHDAIQQAAFDAGIFGVPTFVVDGEIFFGREHLPRIRWILSGHSGPAPDIAYEHETIAGFPASSKPQGPLTVAIDFNSPSALLAVAPTCTIAEQAGVMVDWQPFLVSPSKDHGSGAESSRGARHRRLRADYMARDTIRYAASRGLPLSNLHRQTDSSLAALGLLWTRREAPSLTNTYVQQVFERYWREALNIQDGDALRALLAEMGAPTAGFTAYVQGEGRADLERLQSELLRAGIFEVPTYLLDDQIYVGCQHLPLIHRLLSANG